MIKRLRIGPNAASGPAVFFLTSSHVQPTSSSGFAVPVPLPQSLCSTMQRRHKGDFSFNVLHNSNPQHGGAYNQTERRLREDEVEDFLKSVKGWTHNAETDAIRKTFAFASFDDAYEFMGRLFAFCYGTDKYPPVTWQGASISIELYSPHFKGLSKREARIAAFCNDQFNMQNRSKDQRERLREVSSESVASDAVGDSVEAAIHERECRRAVPVDEASGNVAHWR